MKKKDIPIVCFCIIFCQGRILLLKRAPKDTAHPNTWWFPGGHLEEGETLEQGLIREVKEESDIDLDVSDVSLVLQDTSTNGKPLFLFVATTDRPFVALKDGEHTEYVWVSPCNILQYNRTPIFITYINEAIMFQSSHYGLTSLSAPGSVYSEAVISASEGPVIRQGVVSDKSKVNSYSAPIIYKKNCASCSGSSYGASDCGCDAPAQANPYGMLFVPAQKEDIVYGAAEEGTSSTMKVVYVLLVLGALVGGYMVMKKK
jgi:8-oxo-dGTP pyrophosphatase MutT (NUDIX family)